jgi:mono/diheme cytochrome c family protein
MHIRVFIAALLTIWLSAAATDARAADPEQGEVLARTWCAECHIVADDQTRGSADVPPFRQIARRRTDTAFDLVTFLADPHPAMPPLSLTRREIDDIVAYIGSLKPAVAQ